MKYRDLKHTPLLGTYTGFKGTGRLITSDSGKSLYFIHNDSGKQGSKPSNLREYFGYEYSWWLAYVYLNPDDEVDLSALFHFTPTPNTAVEKSTNSLEFKKEDKFLL